MELRCQEHHSISCQWHHRFADISGFPSSVFSREISCWWVCVSMNIKGKKEEAALNLWEIKHHFPPTLNSVTLLTWKCLPSADILTKTPVRCWHMLVFLASFSFIPNQSLYAASTLHHVPLWCNDWCPSTSSSFHEADHKNRSVWTTGGP